MSDVKTNAQYQHPFDKGGDCATRGRGAESRFTRCANDYGWIVTPANFEMQVRQKIDFILSRDDKTMYVDVKGLKRIKRTDDNFCFDRVWLELARNDKQESSWLYGGLSDVISFETSTEFIFVKRIDLITAANILVNHNNPAKNARDSLYKLYKRPTKYGIDHLSQIHIQDVINISNDVWCKHPDDFIYPTNGNVVI